MIDTTKPQELWDAYEKGRDWKSNIDLYETVEENERFYVGDQWHGLNAPNIIKPVLNHLKRVVSMLVAKIAADDIAAKITPFLTDEASEQTAKMISHEVDKVMELLNIKQMAKRGVRNAAVDGDGCVYTYWDADAPTGQDSKGMVAAELIENINVYFANPHTVDVQGQRFIIIARRLPVEDVRERAESNGVKKLDIDDIKPDDDSHQGEENDNGLCTLLTVLFRKGDTIHAVETTEKVIVRREWDTELHRYPVAWLPWEIQRSRMHGRAAITDMIPNQIAINKVYAGLIRVMERMGFPIMLLNRDYMKGFNGMPGSILEISGAPMDVRQFAAYLEGAPINPNITAITDNLINQTRDTMGTNDATTGDVRPDNASAIIALQTADTVPLELIRQNYNGFIEDIVRNIVDMMSANYGIRMVEQDIVDEMGQPQTVMKEFDFDSIEYENLRVSVDIGAASMWSEITQMDAINSIFTSGIMDDVNRFKLYLETVPDKYVPNKAKLLAWCDEQMQAMQAPAPVNALPTGELTNEPYGGMPLEYNAPTIAQEGMLNV